MKIESYADLKTKQVESGFIPFQNGYSVKTILWVIFFCYTTFVALIFQKFLLPMFPHYHGGGGLLTEDSLYFHSVAVKLAAAIQAQGWSSWTAWPTPNATGNSAVLAALYALFGNDPSLIIPFNAAIHATSGVILYLIGRLLWPGKTGNYAGIIAATLFIAFPSALNWYSQVHKDGYLVLGFLIIFYSWIRGIENEEKLKTALWIVVGTCIGMACIAFVRPYIVKLLGYAIVCVWLFLVAYLIWTKKMKEKWYLVLIFGIAMFIAMLFNASIPEKYKDKHAQISGSYLREIRAQDWQWQNNINNIWIPDIINKNIEHASRIRLHNIIYSQTWSAGSLIDEDVKPDNIYSAMAYLPRSLKIAMLAPFPVRWFEKISITRLVAVAETLLWYLMIPGIFMTFYYRRSLSIGMIAVLCLFFLTVYGYTMPNVGTLYRIRYVFLFYFILLGSLGWVNFYLRRKDLQPEIAVKQQEPERYARRNTSAKQDLSNSRSNIANAGMMVIMLTVASYLLLFVRDVILARWFGLGSDLDTFFVAMILPMFLVSVLCNPLGIAVIPPFLSLGQEKPKQEVQMFISKLMKVVLISSAAISLVLYLLVPLLIPLVGGKFSPETIEQAKKVMFFVIPIFFFSGPVIMANALLNALKRFAVPSLAQAIVPLVAIMVLFTLGTMIGIYAVAIGMLAGQLINLIIVAHYLKKEGFSLTPARLSGGISNLSPESENQLRVLSSQYFQLVLSALFISMVIPVNSVMAASLSSGSVSALSLGSKFTLFMTGVIGTGIATVMLPYFSSFAANNLKMEIRRELSFFMLLATALSIPLSILIYYMAEPVVRIIFEGNAFTSGDVKTVSRIIEYGIIQLPFFTCSMLLMKYVTAKRKTAVITFTAVVGLALNIVLNLILMQWMGVAGISLATTLAMMISTVLFILLSHRSGDISWVDVVMITLNWLLFLTMILCIHYQSTTGIIISSVSLVFISIEHFRVLFQKITNYIRPLFAR